MVLSAMTGDGRIVTPYRLIAQGMNFHKAYDLLREAQDSGTTFYCPHCLKFHKKQVPVRFRGTSPENARPHFFHPSDGTDKCAASSGESEAHFITKDYLAEWLRRAGATEVFAEYHLDNLEGHVRRPDILALYEQMAIDGSGLRVEAHEIQISPINSSEIAQRTADILSQCRERWPGAVASVTWYLAGGNPRKREIKDYFLGAGDDVKGYRLWWDGADKIPTWQWLLSATEIADYKKRTAQPMPRQWSQPIAAPQENSPFIKVGNRMEIDGTTWAVTAIGYISGQTMLRPVVNGAIDYSGEPKLIPTIQPRQAASLALLEQSITTHPHAA